jgi:hypothetical protein
MQKVEPKTPRLRGRLFPAAGRQEGAWKVFSYFCVFFAKIPDDL